MEANAAVPFDSIFSLESAMLTHPLGSFWQAALAMIALN
jgi:hypothetical protein